MRRTDKVLKFAFKSRGMENKNRADFQLMKGESGQGAVVSLVGCV